MNSNAKTIKQLGCVDEDIGVGGSCLCQNCVLFFFSSYRIFKFLHAKKEAQEAFDAKIN
jgi:hypothetical protein